MVRQVGGFYARVTAHLGTPDRFLVHRVLVTIQVNFRGKRGFASLGRTLEFPLAACVAYLQVVIQADQKLSAIRTLVQLLLVHHFDVSAEASGFQVLTTEFQGTLQKCRVSLPNVELQLAFCEKRRLAARHCAGDGSGCVTWAGVLFQIGREFLAPLADLWTDLFVNSPDVMDQVAGFHECVATLAGTLDRGRVTVSDVVVQEGFGNEGSPATFHHAAFCFFAGTSLQMKLHVGEIDGFLTVLADFFDLVVHDFYVTVEDSRLHEGVAVFLGAFYVTWMDSLHVLG